jgi:hypothetical protein
VKEEEEMHSLKFLIGRLFILGVQYWEEECNNYYGRFVQNSTLDLMNQLMDISDYDLLEISSINLFFMKNYDSVELKRKGSLRSRMIKIYIETFSLRSKKKL